MRAEMIRAGTIPALLLAHCFHDKAHGFPPSHIEGLHAAGSFPIAVSETDRIAEGIQFILALSDAGLHLGFIAALQVRGGASRSAMNALA